MKVKSDLVIVTGLSGAGKHQLLYQLEDLGYFCVDNLPAPLILQSIRLLQGHARLAIGADVRTSLFLEDLREALLTLRRQGQRYRIVFLEAEETELARRFAETRRPHPVSGSRSLRERIQHETEALAWLRAQAELVLDTTQLSPPQLKGLLSEWLEQGVPQARMVVSSFGYKYGVPEDADFVFDVRFLPNPFYVSHLKHQNGTARAVKAFVLKQTAAKEAIERMQQLLSLLLPHFVKEGKIQLHVAVGCTGGQHRSVVVAAALREQLRRKLGSPVMLYHRELENRVRGQHD